MSILSWDDFEDDEAKQAAPEHQPAPVESQKATHSQMVSDAHNTSSDVATAQPLEPIKEPQNIQPIQWQEHLLP